LQKSDIKDFKLCVKVNDLLLASADSMAIDMPFISVSAGGP
jgi:hypothetical protein